MEGKIAKIRRLLDSREISCTELTQKYLDAIETENGRLNAYVRETPETALRAAAEADRKIAAGETAGPLAGIPMTLKDNISTRGIETTCCSKILQGYVPIYDAAVWDILQKQGAVLLGKTNMDEFAMGSTCESSCFGGIKTRTTRNAFRAEAAAGPRRRWRQTSPSTASVPTPAAPSANRRASAASSGLSRPTGRFRATA